MTEVFFISDTHFNDKTICDGKRRPFTNVEEHDEEIARRWNATVGRNGIIWHLGDFAAGDISIAKRLSGRKRLVLGNNDMRKAAEYAKYFDRVCGMVRYRGFLLSHFPVHPQHLYPQSIPRQVNIHGHMHNGGMEDHRYLNVSCERINYTPIPFDEVVKRAEQSDSGKWETLIQTLGPFRERIT